MDGQKDSRPEINKNDSVLSETNLSCPSVLARGVVPVTFGHYLFFCFPIIYTLYLGAKEVEACLPERCRLVCGLSEGRTTDRLIQL
jgi:hypothetical protein